MAYKQSTEADTQSILKKNKVTLVPAPWGSQKNDVLVQYRYLPEMFERVFNNCLALENNPNMPDKEIIKYHIGVDYVRGVLSLEDYTLLNDDDLYIATSMRIAASHIKKLDINPDQLCEDSKSEIARANKQFFVVHNDDGTKILLSRGVILKAMRDSTIPDLLFAMEGHIHGDFVQFEFYNYKNRTEYMGYLLKEGKNDRQAIDFALMKHGDQYFEEFLEENDIERVSRKATKRILDEMFIMDGYDENVVPTLKL